VTKSLSLLVFLISFGVFAEEKVIYQYKKYEKFDLGDLEVKGQLISPGDLSVRERDRKRFELDLYNRADFDSMIKHDIKTLR
jgi:hypothetical protein